MKTLTMEEHDKVVDFIRGTDSPTVHKILHNKIRCVDNEMFQKVLAVIKMNHMPEKGDGKRFTTFELGGVYNGTEKELEKDLERIRQKRVGVV